MSSAAIDYRSLIQPPVQYRLYNPSDKAIEHEHNARNYVIPAKDQFHVDRKTKVRYTEAGVLPIAGYSYTEIVGKVAEQRVITAQDIVAFLVGEDGVSGKLGKAGVRLLYAEGDERNEAIKKEADETHRLKVYEDAKAVIAAADAENAKRIEAKVAPNPPNQKVRMAYRLIADIETSGSVEVHPFQCPKCYEGIKTETLLRQHISELHSKYEGTLLKAANLAPITEDEVSETPKRKPGRPKKVVTEASA